MSVCGIVVIICYYFHRIYIRLEIKQVKDISN